MELTVCTFLWTDPAFRWRGSFTYTAEHVDRLARAVRANLNMPHRFVVITDQPHDDFGEVDGALTLWPDLRDMGRCYTRLKLFDDEAAAPLGDRFVWMDLDCAVLGDLTPLFDRPEDFVIWGFDARDTYRRQNAYCGSMLMMTRGVRQHVWDSFDPATSPRLAAAQGLVGSDQAWIEYLLGPDEATWTSVDGVYSLRGHFAPYKLPGRAQRRGKMVEPPANARLVFLHGHADASMPVIRQSYPWIDENWRRYAS